jgi:hypothetical protein
MASFPCGLISLAMYKRFTTGAVIIAKVCVDRPYFGAQLPFFPRRRFQDRSAPESSPNLQEHHPEGG